jgi:hypothetical protein
MAVKYSKRLAVLAILFVALFLVLRSRKNQTMKDKLTYWLRFAGFTHEMTKILVAQAAHETGNFTSPVFLANNNFFGMRHPKIRRTLSRGSNLGHAKFDSLQDSVNDFAIWWTYFNMPREALNIEDYVLLLKQKGYYEAPVSEYLRGVNHFYKVYYAG